MSRPREYLERLVDARLDWMCERFPAVMVEGPRATGKTTSLRRRACSTVRLDVPGEMAAFRADPDAALAALDEPVLLDEWQLSPNVLGAVKRSVDEDPSPGRFLLTGSALSRRSRLAYPGTGRIQRLSMLPMTVREIERRTDLPGFFDRLLDGVPADPTDPPDLVGYITMALRSGFPEPALRLPEDGRRAWLADYLADLLTRDAIALEPSPTKRRDASRLRTYFNALASNTGGITDHRSIYAKVGIRRETAEAYEEILLELMIIELLSAWSTNRLKRLTARPKRFLADAALAALAGGLDVSGVLADGDFMGRLLETFVLAQLRPEAEISALTPTLNHLRTKQGRQEIDLIVELADSRIIGIEVKADAAPSRQDSRHLAWLRDSLGDRFSTGIVLHTGPRVYKLDDRITAMPIACIWN